MDFSDFPNYFKAASIASAKFQRYYKSIKRSAVILLILAVIVMFYSFQHSEGLTIVYGVIAVLVALSLILTLLLMIKKYDQLWQECLNFKASCKTATWQFVMSVGEFATLQDRDELQRSFENRMQHIIKEYQELIPHLDSAALKQELLTAKMFELREASFEEKKSFYAQERILVLNDIYFNKAIEHHQKYKLWSLNLILAQVFALGAILFLVLEINAGWSIVALVTMLLSSLVSWLELQSNLERKQRYTLALRELEGMQQGLSKVTLESELDEFVWDTERLISSPNAYWLISGAQKGKQEIVV
ncbi:DUF4231 domain-containing protein [Galbibacter sp.]|jgi:membrane protein YdbS with pleckstrin-like domain|uniref:DUF4231 domain-containing protein n=1 Tax=Galbibacter sp. TaxID=2918471 RepID=UPI003A8E62AF